MTKDQEKIKQYQNRILSLLLKKYEASKAFKTEEVSLQRPQFAIKKISDPLSKDYLDEMNYRKREWIHQAIAELQDQNIIEVKWPKFKEGEEIDKVYLNYEAIEKAYQLAAIIPKKQKLINIKSILLPLSDHPWEWVRKFWSHYNVALSNNQTAGLEIDDSKGYEDLVKTLLFLPKMDEGTMKRVLSHNLFNDTKYFERNVQGRLVSIYKRFGSVNMETDIEYLDAIGIVENPQITLVSGPLEFRSNNLTVNVAELPGGIGLTFDTIKELEIQEINAKAILLIENLTAYHEFLSGKIKEETLGKSVFTNADQILAIYTGGYPHHALRKLLYKLKELRSEIPEVYHWGDIDYGGILIFEHLRRNYFDSLKPLFMDEYIYSQYLEYGIQFSVEYADKLTALLKDDSYSFWHQLIKSILRNKIKLEQESLLINWSK
ncbi:Wadjet anti-phage system protein JetD domain-containing protein [Bacillus alkalicola]|uniref:Topoisomerase IV n=1 Tax=Evansella alkalicola TaxID=745819 RepID=A0ABS6JX34_9BACI|nr:Wadjet anti-phage system protein JetD domain-containing protein [Bacillus alkalicola]MBU9723152.1 topoisomerase IV [Bacillus alkalicola]